MKSAFPAGARRFSDSGPICSGGWTFGQRLYPNSGSFDRCKRMNSISFRLTSLRVAASGSQRISFRMVKSRSCSGVKSRLTDRAVCTPEAVGSSSAVLPDVDLPVRVGDLVDGVHPAIYAALPSTRALVGTIVPEVTSTCSTPSGWFVDVPRMRRAPSATPFMPWM